MNMTACTCNPSTGEESWGILWPHSLTYVESSRFRESPMLSEDLVSKNKVRNEKTPTVDFQPPHSNMHTRVHTRVHKHTYTTHMHRGLDLICFSFLVLEFRGCCFVLFSWGKVLLYSPVWAGTHNGDQANLQTHNGSPASAEIKGTCPYAWLSGELVVCLFVCLFVCFFVCFSRQGFTM